MTIIIKRKYLRLQQGIVSIYYSVDISKYKFINYNYFVVKLVLIWK